MSVYNGAAHLPAAVESILAQEGVDLEFIIVNDGSTDAATSILRGYAAGDSRIRLIEQENTGLTRALIHGCAVATGEYIARQDGDDRSLPGRLKIESDYLSSHPEVSLVSCATEFIGPEDELLNVATRTESPREATVALRVTDGDAIRGVNGHGSVMFRRADYERAGGYREHFRFAQDLDLWTRLTDHGLLAFLPDILYQARFTEDCISARQSDRQRALKQVIAQATLARQRGEDESPLLRQAEEICRTTNGGPVASRGSGAYFIGRMLQTRNDKQALKYLRRAAATNPLNLRFLLAFGWEALRSRL